MFVSVSKLFHGFKRQQSSVVEPEIINNDKSLQIFQPGELTLSMKDVGGCKEAKIELMEIVHFFKKLDMYNSLGASIPKGALFYGSHGVGKSLIVKAAAGECSVPFLIYSCGEFLVGDNGPERLRNVFEIARSLSPAILFLDELQSISKPRTGRGKENLAQRSILEELLIQLDATLGKILIFYQPPPRKFKTMLERLLQQGEIVAFSLVNVAFLKSHIFFPLMNKDPNGPAMFKPIGGGFEEHLDKPVIVLAACVTLCGVDSALQRPGRFDRLIEIAMPDQEARREILEIHLQPIKTGGLTKAQFADRYAGLTNGLSGAQLASLCNEGAIVAGRQMANEVLAEHFDVALDKVRFGVRKIQPFSDKLKKLAAYHNAGHAVVDFYLFGGEIVKNINIFPDSKGRFLCCTGSGGFLCDNKERHYVSLYLAGIAAEEVAFGKYTATGQLDIEHATWAALHSVIEKGFSELGKIHMLYWYQSNWYHMISHFSTCGDGMYAEAMVETRKIIDSCYENSKRLIRKHENLIHKLANALMEKNSLSSDDIGRIIKENEN